ncbi:MAG: HD domain-containing protein [Candidatus Omnitrophica bacterium]|nr:HD domain-containing protein [Candidatus Omnitrophota bacterium]
MSLLNRFPQLEIIQSIASARKISVYLVGGFLRDHILGISKTDFDFAVEKDALKLAQIFAHKIKGAYVVLDKELRCARVVKYIHQEQYTFDFADFRAKTFAQDLNQRDFTINTLAVNLDDLTRDQDICAILIDKKQAIKDIERQCIRQVSAHAFKDDPLRMMRAFSLRSTLGFKIEPKTLQQVKKDKTLIKKVSYERITEELFKVLKSSRTSEVLKEMDKVGLLEEIIPQARIMFHCQQGGYHHLDVWHHSLEAVVQLERILDGITDPEWKDYLNENLSGNRPRYALMKLATLLHDIGKPEARRKAGIKRFSFHGHEHIGRNIIRYVAKMLKVSARERHILEDMVLWHLRPGYLSNFKTPTEKAVYRYFRDTKEEAASILLLSLADQRATRGPLTTQKGQKHHEKICLSLAQKYFDKKKEKVFVRLIDGNDLIKKIKLSPSPLFSEILSRVDEAQALGKITTKKEALALAKKIAAQKD